MQPRGLAFLNESLCSRSVTLIYPSALNSKDARHRTSDSPAMKTIRNTVPDKNALAGSGTGVILQRIDVRPVLPLQSLRGPPLFAELTKIPRNPNQEKYRQHDAIPA